MALGPFTPPPPPMYDSPVRKEPPPRLSEFSDLALARLRAKEINDEPASHGIYLQIYFLDLVRAQQADFQPDFPWMFAVVLFQHLRQDQKPYALTNEQWEDIQMVLRSVHQQYYALLKNRRRAAPDLQPDMSLLFSLALFHGIPSNQKPSGLNDAQWQDLQLMVRDAYGSPGSFRKKAVVHEGQFLNRRHSSASVKSERDRRDTMGTHFTDVDLNPKVASQESLESSSMSPPPSPRTPSSVIEQRDSLTGCMLHALCLGPCARDPIQDGKWEPEGKASRLNWEHDRKQQARYLQQKGMMRYHNNNSGNIPGAAIVTTPLSREHSSSSLPWDLSEKFGSIDTCLGAAEELDNREHSEAVRS